VAEVVIISMSMSMSMSMPMLATVSADAAVVALCVVLGLAVGPFLSVLVAQVPDKGPVSWPSLRDHPPILYWLRAAAPDTTVADPAPDDADTDEIEGARLSPRTVGVTVEVLTPVLFASAGLRWGSSWMVVPFLVLFAALLVVSVIDVEHFRIPDLIVFPALGISLPLIVAVSFVEDTTDSLTFAVIGAGAYFLLLLVAHLVYPAGMGFGDVKLALLMGLFLGWIAPDSIRAVTLVLLGLMIGCVLGVVIGAVLAIVRRKSAAFPFGPALALSTVIAVLFSQQLLATS
jgi:prepilin signal peptidase PulO-like enzyme (type II secretory pathway)